MTGAVWRKVLKYAVALVVAALLVLVVSKNIEPKQKAVPTAVLPADSGNVEKPVVLRTNEVFDKEKYKGLLTIRYFFFNGDVSMGDCILIQTPDGKTMMIDAGVAAAGKQIIAYLDKLGVNTIDIALNTHPHADHIGGYATVVAQKDVKSFYSMNFPYTASSLYNNSLAQVNKKNIPHIIIEEGSTFQLGKEVTVEVLSPDPGTSEKDISSYEANIINQFSLVFKITYKENSFLFTGDIYTDREYKLIEKFGTKLDADMMHAPHHGGTTSSSVQFLQTVSPKIAIISENIFSNLTVPKRYEALGTKVYATGLNGNILITSDGKQLNVVTEKDSKIDLNKVK